MTKPRLSDVIKWLADLGAGRSEFNGKTDKEVYRELRPIAASMVKAYDADVFRAESREAVAATLKWWREADIRERLDAWITINVQSKHIIPVEAATAPVSATARAWLASWYRAKDDVECLKWLRLMHAKCPEAFDYLIQNEMHAASLAVYNQLRPPMTANDLRLEWDDEAMIRQKARETMDLGDGSELRAAFNPMMRPLANCLLPICLKVLANAIAMHAPQHLAALREEFSAGQRIEAAETQRPKRQFLTPLKKEGDLFT